MKNRIVMLAALALLVPAIASAQEARRPRMQVNSIEWLLDRKEEFRPSGEQVAKLEEIAKALNDVTTKQREEIRKLRDEGMSGDRREAFQKMRPLMDEMRKQDDEAVKEALKVLNDEQKKVVSDMIEARRKEMENRQNRRPRVGT